MATVLKLQHLVVYQKGSIVAGYLTHATPEVSK